MRIGTLPASIVATTSQDSVSTTATLPTRGMVTNSRRSSASAVQSSPDASSRTVVYSLVRPKPVIGSITEIVAPRFSVSR